MVLAVRIEPAADRERIGGAAVEVKLAPLSRDPNSYAVSEPELLRTLRLSRRDGFLRDHP